ncbi:MAG: hypothetical protein JO113_09325, partial [Candidatus Eremiobacteraeota bacterium]|nr:hypothetical protein [Candidatus Eremiobacteraeota bacterium]
MIAALIVAFVGAAPENLAATLRAVAARYYQSAGQVAAVAGRDATMDYYDRLLDDAELVSQSSADPRLTQRWRESATAASQLDLSLAMQLMERSYPPMASIRGLGESLVRSSKDGTMQPVSVYVPTQYSAPKPAALIVFLHGNQETESQLLSAPYLRELAESTGTIVVAPYGRGAYDFRGAESDVYDAFDAASQAFAIDARKRYLAGYSMGGFSVFSLAPIHPDDWSAIMSIAGSLLQSRASQLLVRMPANVRYYILTGALDRTVPTLWPT